MVIKKIVCCSINLVLIVGGVACGGDTTESKQKASTIQQSQPSVQASAASQPSTIKGKVLEKLEAPNYTYVLLGDSAGNETWAAIPKTEVAVGEEISLVGGTAMGKFKSKSLNRTFESIIFSSGIVRGSGDKTTSDRSSALKKAVKNHLPAGSGDKTTSGGSSAHTVVAFADIKVEKSTAQNGYTVNELFAKAADLNKKKITVKGQVVKFSPTIMGRNWIHIQDGTGDPAKNTHDLVVTSSETTEKGSIISIEGVLSTGKDFGAGYKYDVIVEEAVVVKSE